MAHRSEEDVPLDWHIANSRPVNQDGDQDEPEGTTGTGGNGDFVGRIAGQDVGYAEETGAEKRARNRRPQGVLTPLDTPVTRIAEHHGRRCSMKGLVYRGPHTVAHRERPGSTSRNATDAVVRITTTNICGSDLHMYEGRTEVEEGKVLGHENMGIVEEVGAGVDRIKVGDRVSVPFNIACGTCRNCTRAGRRSACARTPTTASTARPTATPTWARTTAAGRTAPRSVRRLQPARAARGDDHENDFTMLTRHLPDRLARCRAR